MKRRFAFTVFAVVMAAMVALPTVATGAPKTVAPGNSGVPEQVFAYYNFEKEVAPWAPMTDSPFHAYKFVQRSGSNGCPEGYGSHYAQLITAPKPTLRVPGQIAKYGSWVNTNYVVGGTGVRLVTVQWSARWSYNAVPKPTYDSPAVYVDLKAPSSGMQFAIPPKRDLTYQWQSYSYRTYIKFPGAATGTPVHIGVGWNNVGNSMDLDCLRISIAYPIVQTSPTK